MQCPVELSNILAEIIRIGVLRTRHFADNGYVARCVIEADHIHNLPSLLQDYSLALLLFYWQTERSMFMEQNTGDELGQFKPVWARLSCYLQAAAQQTAHGPDPMGGDARPR